MVSRAPYQYKLKKPVYTAFRLQKLAKTVEVQCLDDRKNALEAYEYFKKLAQAKGEEQDFHARNCMLQCLKLMQGATQNLIKNVETATKINTTLNDGKDTSQSLFDELNQNDQGNTNS